MGSCPLPLESCALLSTLPSSLGEGETPPQLQLTLAPQWPGVRPSPLSNGPFAHLGPVRALLGEEFWIPMAFPE